MDFFHRIRNFPEEVAVWRRQLIRRLTEGGRPLPGVGRKANEPVLRECIDEGISFLREAARMLAVAHGSPRLGNKEDPVDELVYIILARKTREDAYQQTFEALKHRFPTWDDLLAAPPGLVGRVIHGGGLEAKKVRSLLGALGQLRSAFGKCTLDPARDWPDEKLEEFLCSLPEISRKSAYCIMMYAFDRRVFPVDTHVGRVLTRLAPYRELGLDLRGLDHKKLQAVLADLVPPNLRYSLHVNLVVHGRTICGQRPQCDRCLVNKLCANYRTAETARIEKMNSPTVVDLFCGAGGLSEGFTKAGFRVIGAVDNDPLAVKTYRLNRPDVRADRVFLRDITTFRKGELRRLVGPRVDVLVGAPPCQGFSHAGFRSKKARTGYKVASDERNFLFERMISAALELMPRLVLMENVPGMQSARRDDVSFLQAAAAMLEKRGGFETAIWRLNAAAFGVPQDRIRYFLVASRTGSLPAPPAEEYQDIHRPGFDPDALPPVTLGEAIFDLPAREAAAGTAVERRESNQATGASEYRRYLLKHGLLSGSPIIYNHAARYHNERDLELYALLNPGEDSVHAIELHGRRDLMKYRRDVFDDKYYRLRADRPCKTIVAHLAKDGNAYIHPSQTRSITVREAARVQSFPDDYAFCGSPSDQWVQLGNAVPPVLAEAIAQVFKETLQGSQRGGCR
jgi:DNA (cytosine-5)-methyltransferase 1